MRDGWEIKTLGDVSEIVNGGTPNTRVKEFWDGDILWITPKDMGKLKTNYVDKTERSITSFGLKNSSAKLLPINSVILSSRAPIGHLAINRKPISTNQGCKGIVPKNNLDAKYLFYYLKNSVQYLNEIGHGTTFKELSGSKLAQVTIPVPPLSEQKRIVAIMDEAFAAIDKAKANVQKNLENAKELFQSELDRIFTEKGDDWVEKKLVDVAQFINGRAYNKQELLSKGKYRVLRVGNFFTNKNWYYSDLELEEDKYCDHGDLLYAWSASFGPRIWQGEKVIYHYHIWKVRPNNKFVNKEFLFQLLEWDTKNLKAKHGTGTTMIHVSKGSIENRIVPIPPLKQQKEIVHNLTLFLSNSRKLEVSYLHKLNKLEELKKSILQKAFAGELLEKQLELI